MLVSRPAEAIRAELLAAMNSTKRNRRRLVKELTWELDRATSASAINARREAMGLAPDYAAPRIVEGR